MKIYKKRNQSGLVSIMIASIMMVIMALVTLGFTRLVQNEQRQAIDDQLSKQAFYAAESGINIAASSAGFPGERKEDCDVSQFEGDGAVTDDLDSNGEPVDVKFTCLMIDPTPEDLVFGNDSITTNKSKVVPIRTSAAPSEITFQWEGSSRTREANCTTSTMDFDPNDADWDKIPLLKLDLIGVPLTSTTTPTFSRDDLMANQFSAIFYPCEAGGVVSIPFLSGTGSDNVGKIVPVTCADEDDITIQYSCEISITLADLVAARGGPMSEYYARFNSIYSELNVRITSDDASGSSALFAGAQAVVDSTGRANDVFHRLQARVPLYENFVLPTAIIQTLDDVCKLYEVQVAEVIDGCN